MYVSPFTINTPEVVCALSATDGDAMSSEANFFKIATPFYFDAVKLLGTGNSTGLFGAGVALYYFSTRSPDVLYLIKLTAFIYLGGVALFAIAFFALFMFAIHQSHSDSFDSTKPTPWLDTAIFASLLSFSAWWGGTICAAIVFFRL